MIRTLPLIPYSPVLIAVLILIFLVGAFFIFGIHKNLLRRWKHREQLKNGYEKELLQAELELKQHMIDNITYEMRENIGQSLSLAKLQLAGTEGTEPPKQQNLKSARAMVSSAMHAILSLLYTTNKKAEEDGILVKALQLDIDNISKRSQVAVSMNINIKSPESFVPEHNILLRIIQEWIYFLAGELRAGTIRVELQVNGDRISASIIASTAKAERNPVRTALEAHLQRRAEIIGATLTTENILGNIFFSIYFPITKTLHHG